MSETLRDLVVSLSLNSDNFSRNIKSVSQQIKEAESAFKLAAAGVKNFENSQSGTAAKLDLLRQKQTLQSVAVKQYEQALQKASAKMTKAQADVQKYTAALAAQEKAQVSLRAKIDQASVSVKLSEQAFGKNSEGTELARKKLEALKKEYSASKDEIKKLQGQLKSANAAIQNSQDAISKAKQGLNETRAAMKTVTAEVARLESRWSQAGNTLIAFAGKADAANKKLGALGRALSRTVSVPLSALGGFAVKASVDFESAFAGVHKTVVATDAEYADLAKSVKQMSTEIATDTGTISGVMENAGQLGIKKDNLVSFTRTIIDLSNSTNIAANEGATAIAQFANVTRMAQSDFGRFGSALVDLGNNFATTESAIMDMATRLAAAGSQVGLSQAQILGFATALSSVGLEAEAGGTAFGKAITQMQVAVETGGQKLNDFAKVSGLTTTQFQELWKSDPAGAIEAFIVGLSKMDEEGVSAIVTLQDMGFTEVRLRDTLLRATNATELFSRAQTTANTAWKKNTALANEAGERYATTESRLKNLKNTVVLAGQQIGDDLNPLIQDLIDKGMELVSSFMELDQQQRMQIIRWAAIAMAAGPVITILGKGVETVGKITGALGRFSAAVGNAGGGIKGLISVIGSSKIAVAALAAGVLYGAYRLYDYASGAQEAREALERLKKTAEEWAQTNVTTAYEQAPGLGAFGLDGGDFGHDSLGATSWLDTVRKVWSDGKRETDAIVAENVEAFTKGTDKIRSGLKGIRESGGMSGALGDMDEDLTRLDQIDEQVDDLLKKRQNGTLSGADLDELQALYDEREAIRVRYQLVADADGGFGAIVQGVEAAMSRNADAGDTWANAYAAATQGLGAFTQGLNQEYDARYKVIAAMEEGEEKQQKLNELQAWYNEQALSGAKAYYAALKESAQETGVFEKGGEYEGTIKQLGEVSDLIDKVSDGTATEKELATALAGLDEKSVVEVTTALTDMQAAAQQAGETLPGDMQGILDTIENIKTAYQTTGQVFDESLTGSLKKMFGEGEDAEVYEIHATLNAENLDASYDAWAAGAHADIIPSIDASGLTVDASGIVVDGLTGHVTAITADNEPKDIQDLILNPETGHVTVITADNEPMDIHDLILNPETGHVNAVTADNVPMNILKLNLNPETGHVEAVTADGKTLPIEDLELNPLNGTVTAITADDTLTITIPQKDQLEGVLTALRESEGLQKPIIQLQGEVSDVTYNPDGKYSNSRRPDLEYNKGHAENTQGGDSPFTVSNAEIIQQYAAALLEVQEARHALESADPLDLNYDVLQGQAEAATANMERLRQTVQTFMGDGEAFESFAQEVANGLQLLADGALGAEESKGLNSLVGDLSTIMAFDATGLGTSIAEGLSSGLSAYGWQASASSVAKALEAALRAATQTHSPSQMTAPIGVGVAQGVGEGMRGYSFGGDAAALSAALVGALSNMSSKAKTVGQQFSRGLAGGITSGTGWIREAARKAALAAKTAAEVALDEHSPSKVGMDIGGNFSKGISLGVANEKQVRAIQNAARYVGKSLAGSASKSVNQDNRRTYDQRNSGNVEVRVDNFVANDRQDLRAFALELSRLNRRRQFGYGGRG